MRVERKRAKKSCVRPLLLMCPCISCFWADFNGHVVSNIAIAEYYRTGSSEYISMRSSCRAFIAIRPSQTIKIQTKPCSVIRRWAVGKGNGGNAVFGLKLKIFSPIGFCNRREAFVEASEARSR